jgi:hypothetical protein
MRRGRSLPRPEIVLKGARIFVPHSSVAPINGRIPSDAWSLALSRALRRSSNESCRNLSRTLPAIE